MNVMREADVMECRAGGFDPAVALDASVAASDESFQEMHNGEMLAGWGYKALGMLSGVALVWMLSFEGADRHKVYFARTSRARMHYLLKHFSLLRCEVWSGHDVALKWLRWLGFTQTSMHWRGEELFYVMEKERD